MTRFLVSAILFVLLCAMLGALVLVLVLVPVQSYYNSRCMDFQGDRAILTVRGVYCEAKLPLKGYSVFKRLDDLDRLFPNGLEPSEF